MTHCAKCGTELIGSRKFCAACGTPAGDPRSPAASTGQAPATAAPYSPPAAPQSSRPSAQYAPAPVSQVNPFAQTAGPNLGVVVRPSDYGPPPGSVPSELATTTPGVGDPSAAPQVSPLAISNVASSGRGAFEEAMASSRQPGAAAPGSMPGSAPGPIANAGAPPAPIPKRAPVPGTEIMQSIANPAAALAGAAGAPSVGDPNPAAPGVAKRKERTQLLGAPGAPSMPGVSSMPGAPSVPGAPGSAPAVQRSPSVPDSAGLNANLQPPPPPPPVASTYQPQPPPIAPAIPPAVVPQPPPMTPYAAPAIAQAPYPMQPAQPPIVPTPQGWNPAAPPPYMQQPQPIPYAAGAPPYMPQQPPPPAPPPQSYGYGFSYQPGARVNVTWSNGQRYPGTIQQVTGSQCLVVFPDGQHHWVEMQYVAPA